MDDFIDTIEDIKTTKTDPIPVPVKPRRRKRSCYDFIDKDANSKCQRCNVWKPNEVFMDRGKTFKRCRVCREKTRADYHAKWYGKPREEVTA